MRNHLIICAMAGLLSGCVVGIDRSGYETRPFGVDTDYTRAKIVHYTAASADMRGYCARNHGRFITNGPGCVIDHSFPLVDVRGENCTEVVPRDGITPTRLADLTALETAICKGWYPAAPTDVRSP